MKIKNEYIIGEVNQILPKIFSVSIDDSYERTMLFCRYIEFYESPYDEIRNKFFTWEKFMSVYRNKNKKDIFTYPEEWVGFGIPSDRVENCIKVFSKDSGPYDEIMNTIYTYCKSRFTNPITKWYLIGTDNSSKDTINHEIAHGLYYTNEEYKKNCKKLIENIKSEDYNSFKKKIVEMGYKDDRETIDDEIQAWMSTGLSNGLDTDTLKKYQKEFVENFNNFNIKLNENISLKNLIPAFHNNRY